MYKTILVPVAPDHERDTAKALEVARLLADDDAKIVALTVVEAMPGYVAGQLPENYGQMMIDEVADELNSEIQGAKDVTPVVVEGHSARTILDYAEEHQADCIVVSSHRPGLSDYLLGSTAAKVVRHAQCAVHVMR